MKKLILTITLLVSATSFADSVEVKVANLIKSRNYKELKKVCKENKIPEITAEHQYATCVDAESKKAVKIINSFGLFSGCTDAEELFIAQRGEGNDQVRVTRVHDFELKKDSFYVAQKTGMWRKVLNSIEIDFITGVGLAISEQKYGQTMKLVSCIKTDKVTKILMD